MIRTSFAKKPYILVNFQGGRAPLSPLPPLDPGRHSPQPKFGGHIGFDADPVSVRLPSFSHSIFCGFILTNLHRYIVWRVGGGGGGGVKS